jgi:hypothetical protein
MVEVMAGKLVAFIAVSIMIGMAAGYAASVAFAPKSTAAANPIILNPTNVKSDPDRSADLGHHTLLNADGKITGRVILVGKYVEDEQDRYHFLVLPDLAYKNMVNDRNTESLSGALMIELLYKDNPVIPRMHIGQHVEIHGPHVTDNNNGWNEIDPANFIKDIGV